MKIYMILSSASENEESPYYVNRLCQSYIEAELEAEKLREEYAKDYDDQADNCWRVWIDDMELNQPLPVVENIRFAIKIEMTAVDQLGRELYPQYSLFLNNASSDYSRTKNFVDLIVERAEEDFNFDPDTDSDRLNYLEENDSEEEIPFQISNQIVVRVQLTMLGSSYGVEKLEREEDNEVYL